MSLVFCFFTSVPNHPLQVPAMSDNPEKTEDGAATDAVEEATPAEGADEKGATATVEHTGPCECVIHIEARADYLEKRYREELQSVQAEVALPGFRRGKAPVTLVERRMGRTLKNDVVSSVISECFDEAVEENDLNIVSQTDAPELEELQWEPGQPIEVDFRCEVLPQLELDEETYKGLQVEVPVLEVDDELFEQEKKRFAQQFATWEEVKGKGIDWDDFVEVAASAPEAGWAELEHFYPRSERIGPFKVEGIKAVLGEAKVGDELELDAEVDQELLPDFPELESLVGRKVTLKLTIRNAVRRHVPAIDDDLAKKIGLENVAEIEDMLRERLEGALSEHKAELTRRMVVDALLEKVDFELP